MKILCPGWEHFAVRDARPEGVRMAAEAKEHKRRGGHVRGNRMCGPPRLDPPDDHAREDEEFQRYLDRLLDSPA